MRFQVYKFSNQTEENHVMRWEEVMTGEFLEQEENKKVEKAEKKMVENIEK